MGLEKVKDDILKDAEQRAEDILNQAQQEKESLLKDAEQEAQEIVEQAKQAAEQEAEQQKKKELAAARMDARRKQLAARQDVLEHAFQRFKERVQDMDEDTEQELVDAVLAALQDNIDIGTVYTAARNKQVAAEYGDVEERDIRGVIVETTDGTRRFDYTFEDVADKVISENKKQVAQVLFEE